MKAKVVNDKPVVVDGEPLPLCPTDPGELATWLAMVADAVLAGRIDARRGQIAERIGATLLKAIELSRKPKPHKATPEEQALYDEMMGIKPAAKNEVVVK